MDALIGTFPIDVAAVRKAGPALDASFASDDPDAALEKVETDLSAIYRDQGNRLALESKRELLSYLLAAVSLRRLLEGETVEQVAARTELSKYVTELKSAAGPIDLTRFGGKVAKVFTRLGF